MTNINVILCSKQRLPWKEGETGEGKKPVTFKECQGLTVRHSVGRPEHLAIVEYKGDYIGSVPNSGDNQFELPDRLSVRVKHS